MKKIITSVLIVCCLSSCSLFGPVSTPTPEKYLLNSIPGHVPSKRTSSSIIFVSTPEAAPIFNTTQMAYIKERYKISYYSENEWAETPSQMLLPLLAQTLENTHAFKAVVTPPFNGPYNYVLNTEILALQQDLTCPLGFFVMSLRVQLIKAETNKIVGTKQFIVRQPILRKTPYGGVYAGNQASAKILQQIAEYTLKHTR